MTPSVQETSDNVPRIVAACKILVAPGAAGAEAAAVGDVYAQPALPRSGGSPAVPVPMAALVVVDNAEDALLLPETAEATRSLLGRVSNTGSPYGDVIPVPLSHACIYEPLQTTQPAFRHGSAR